MKSIFLAFSIFVFESSYKTNFGFQEVAKRTVTKSVIEMENGDDEEGDFGDEDLFHQQVGKEELKVERRS